MASVIKELQSIYQPQSEYHRTVGSKEKFETRLFCDNPNNLNPATRQLTVTQNLSSGYHYDLSEAYVWMMVYLRDTATPGNYAAGVNVSLNVDTFFSEVNIQIANTDINGGYGSKKYCHKGAHLLKLIQLDPEEAKAIRDKELFYPDSSNATAAYITPYSLYGKAVALDSTDAAIAGGAIGTVSTVVLGLGGSGGGGAGGINAAGIGGELLSAFTRITKNRNYNAGHDARRIKLDNAKRYAVCIPLKYYAPSLATLKDGLTNVPIKFTFQRPLAAECIQTINGVAAGDCMIADAGFEVRIPTYLPDSERMVALTSKISRGIKEVKKYVDLDIYQSSSTFAAGSTSTVNTWVNAVDRRPVGAMIAFQYTGDYQAQTGNNIKTAQIQFGSGQLFPKNQVQLLGTGNTAIGARPVAPFSEEQITINAGFTTDQTQLYLDFLRFTGADQNKLGPSLTWRCS